MCVACYLLSSVHLFMTPWTVATRPFLDQWNSPGKNTGWVATQGIFPTQGLNLGLLHCRQTLYCLSHQGNPNLLNAKKYL